jgi:hypothetical protein
MPSILLRIQARTNEEAAKMADNIKSAGGITYVNTEGGEVTVSVGDVTVENA